MKYFAALFFIFLCKTAASQDLIENYYSFGGAITQGRETDALAFAEKILPETASLSARRQAIFYYQLAGLHENKKNNELAIDFYERSLKLEPDFYVPHLALGYLYLGRVNLLSRQVNAEKDNIFLRQKYRKEYELYLKTALTHLEKAMACDPNEEAFGIIKNGYKTLQDPVSLNSLDERLKQLAKNCITVLAE